MSAKTFCLLLVFFGFVVSKGMAFDEQDILNYFGSRCQSQGDFTRSVLNDSQALVTMIEQIRDDENCVSISGALSQIGHINKQVQILNDQTRDEVRISSLESQESDLLSLINNQSDSDVKYELRLALKDLQLEKINLIHQTKFENRKQKSDYRPLFSQVVYSTSLAYEQIAKNALCIDRHPNVLPTVGSFISSISYSISGINPIVGLSLGASTELLGMIVEASRKKKFNGLINNVRVNTQSPAAYKCALESLSNRWCEIIEVDQMRKFKMDINKNPKLNKIKTAFKIIDEELPVVIDWLNELRTGLEPSTSADASRLERIYNRRAKVLSAKAEGYGLVSEKRALFESSNDKWSILRPIITELAGPGHENGNSHNNPLFEKYTAQYAPYYLLGFSEVPKRGDELISFSEFQPKSDWPGGGIPDYDLGKVSGLFQKWVGDAEILVEEELSLVSRPDPLQVLSTAFERIESDHKIYPANALYFIQEFLESQGKVFEGQRINKIYLSTLQKIKCVNLSLDTVEYGVDEDSIVDLYEVCKKRNETFEEFEQNVFVDEDAKATLQKIITTLGISNGTRTFQNRIEMILRKLLDSFITNASRSDLNVISQLLASESVLQKIREVKSTDNWGLMTTDIDQAKSIAMSNLGEFTSLFDKNIKVVLRDYYQKRNEKDPTLRKVYLKNRESLCTLLSTAPKWPSIIPKRFCLGIQMKSGLKNAPNGPYLSESYLNSSFGSRVCSYRKFIRYTRIFQTWDL